ncbi:MAG: DUF448 domain-containing protein [Planctomycetales bacterium]|nr:DUF448 domain-containing protein [bacterium]UNM08377.1 MAG: DUF448 domain-containing protein [Planctomycetales bacterium]
MGCRNKQEQGKLLRFQLDDEGRVRHVSRPAESFGGRSVYLCPDRACLRAVLKRGVLVFRHSKYAKIVVRLNELQARRLARAFRHVPVD